MACTYGLMFWSVYLLVILAVAVVWTYYSVKFFKKATEYYQSELDNKTKKEIHAQELLAKFDQLVDVLKVK